MKEHALKCPNCNASIEIDDGIDIFFCKYCGYKIILEGQSDASINAKVRIKDMEHQERMKDKQYAQERYKIEKEYKRKNFKEKADIILPVLVMFACVLFLVISFTSSKIESDKEEKELEELVEEIKEDIDDKNFDDAYYKTKSLCYTSGYSIEIEKKWDRIRENLIEEIQRKSGDSSYKSDNNGGLFDWFD